jgi:hypothetical protein
MYVPRRGECDIQHFATSDALVDYLRRVYVSAAADPQKALESVIVAVQGKVLKITGERARSLELPDGTSVELHPGPPAPEPTGPHALIPESWVS